MEQSTEEKLRILCANLKEQGIEIEEISHLTLAVESTKMPIHKKAVHVFIQNWTKILANLCNKLKNFAKNVFLLC